MNLLENLTRAKQEKEKSKYEVEMLKQRLAYHLLPEPLNSLELPLPLPPTSVDSIINSKTRQVILERHWNIVEHTKRQMMILYVMIAKAKMDECQMQLDPILVHIRPDSRSTTTSNQGLTPAMINIVQERFKIIDERMQYFYKLKLRFLEEQSNQRKAARSSS